MNNGKKEFPISGLEEDATSKWGRKYLCYIQNNVAVKRFVKRAMNKRFRKGMRFLISEQDRDYLCWK